MTFEKPVQRLASPSLFSCIFPYPCASLSLTPPFSRSFPLPSFCPSLRRAAGKEECRLRLPSFGDLEKRLDCILTQILFVIACFAALGVWDCCLEEQKRWRERATKTSIFIGTFLLCSGPYVITSLVPSNDAQNKTVSGKMWLGTSV
ncbi:uncharacterized protein LOC122703381 isoform X1 [Cervus elaphus]|uniref:uncharacterized protein LOC122703381 isoform X1 n=1 Tax=Cervus elaphus TaxID=9860 RepID=UPI001CC27CBE|nr:uncharacterized protein LOC122703381 isoform X1 [Cervus elaphus]